MQGSGNLALLVGRLLMSLLFILGGWGTLTGAAAAQAMLAKYNLPMPAVTWLIAVVVELGGGLAILFGLLTRPVAFICAVWCVATALIAHTNFAERIQEVQFFKNMGMTGGYLYIAVFGAGAWSLDAWWRGSRGVVPAE